MVPNLVSGGEVVVPPMGTRWGPRHRVYVPIARRIVAEVVGLRARFPSLVDAGSRAMTVEERPELGMRWSHRHGGRMVPNPAYDARVPYTAVAPRVEVLDAPHGLRLDLLFYEGTWPGLDPVDPIAVGAMNVVVRVDAPDASLRREMTEAVGRIVRAAASEAPIAGPARSVP